MQGGSATCDILEMQRSHLFPDLTLKRHHCWGIKGTEATGLGYDLVCTQEKGQALFSRHPQKQTALELQINKPMENKRLSQDAPQASF